MQIFGILTSFLLILNKLSHNLIYKMPNSEPDQFVFSKEIFISIKKEDIHDYYKIEQQELGKGAFGTVYKGKCIGSQGPWRAIKKMQRKNVANTQMLMNQIQIMITLDHPTICKLYDIFEWKQALYLVTDLCQGGELFDKLEEVGTFSEETARTIFRQIIEGVYYCHNRQIAHRDLKPQNFLFLNKQSLNLKLIDFGLAFRWEQDMNKQLKKKKLNKLVGTSYYLSPQVATCDYDERCDIWSCGVILYMLVSAAAPFDGDSDKQIIYNVRKFNYKFINPQFQNISKELKDLLKKIFVPDEERISLNQIFQHPWMKIDLPNVPLNVNFHKMALFTKYSKLKKLSAIFIASQFSESQVQQLGQIFRQIDLDKNGTISIQQLKKALSKQKDQNVLSQLRQMMNSIDTDKDGTINYTQFLASALDKDIIFSDANLKKMFNKLDKNKSGSVQRQQLMELFEQNGLKDYNGKSLNQIMMSCDKDGDGEITFQEFKASMLE